MDHGSKRGKQRLVLVQAGPRAARQSDGGAGMSREPQRHEHAGMVRQQLDYVTDMIRQMQVMAWQAGCGTLAGILELAHREADIQRRGNGELDGAD